MSKTIQAYIDKHPDKFESWHSEDHNERQLDYWIYCRNPYFNPAKETQTIHADTVKDAISQMKNIEKGWFDGYRWRNENSAG